MTHLQKWQQSIVPGSGLAAGMREERISMASRAWAARLLVVGDGATLPGT
jgi:hypothetical protein